MGSAEDQADDDWRDFSARFRSDAPKAPRNGGSTRMTQEQTNEAAQAIRAAIGRAK